MPTPKRKTPTPYRYLGELLAARRRQRGITQKQIADRLGYSSSQFISNFECGIAAPPLKKAKVILKMLDIAPEAYVNRALFCENEIMLKALKKVG